MHKMKKNITQFLKDPKLYQYGLVGGLSAAADIALFLLFIQKLQIHYLIVATFSFIIATYLNYILCRLFIFKNTYKHSTHKQFLLVYAVSGVGLLIHHSMLFLTFEAMSLSLPLSKILAMSIAFGWNFLSRKHLVFAT